MRTLLGLPEVKALREASAWWGQGQGSELLPPGLWASDATRGALSQELVTDGSAVDFEDSGFTGFKSHTPLIFLLLFAQARNNPPPPPHWTHISLGRTPWKQVGGGGD